MTISTEQQLLLATAVLGGSAALYLGLGGRQGRLPPGPQPAPIVGNLSVLPAHHPWLTYAKWSETYDSDVIHLKVLGTDLIILNSAAVKAQIERKSGIYSGRPRMTMINELIGLFWHFGFMPHADQWRDHRKIFSSAFTPGAVKTYQERERKWVRRFLQNLVEKPGELTTHVQHLASGIALEVTFGLEVQPSGQPDPFIHAATQSIQALGAAGLFGSYLVDYLPILKYVPTPLAAFKKQAKEWRVSVDIAASVPFAVATGNIAKGDAPTSIVKTLLDSGADENVVRPATAAMFANGSAASVSALTSFFLAMLQHPSVQAKAQAELDNLLGNRLPTHDDEASLPYVSAIIREVLRFYPAAPLGFPHLVKEEDELNGYRIPAGSVVIANAWAILRDPGLYGDDAGVFRPERFLDSSGGGGLDGNVRFPDVAFGWGRRVCPGKGLAMDEMFLAVASVLKVFEIKRKVGGVKSEREGEFTSGLLSYPLPFECDISLRSEEAKALLESVPLL